MAEPSALKSTIEPATVSEAYRSPGSALGPLANVITLAMASNLKVTLMARAGIAVRFSLNIFILLLHKADGLTEATR